MSHEPHQLELHDRKVCCLNCSLDSQAHASDHDLTISTATNHSLAHQDDGHYHVSSRCSEKTDLLQNTGLLWGNQVT
jgi:hypothetical protein